MKIGIFFPDYGSQFVGMAKDLYDDSRLIQEYFEEASNCVNINFVKLCFASSESELSKLQNAFLSLFLVSVATAALIKETGIKIDKVAGMGIGEFSAITTAKGLSFPDGLYILSKLTEFLQNKSTDQLDSQLNIDIIDDFIIYFEKIDFKNLQVPLISCVDAKEIIDAKNLKKYVVKNLTKPHSMKKLLSRFDDCDIIIVPTPGIELSKDIMKALPGKKVITIAQPADLVMLKTTLS
ncbi:acyltransferase domain-containing protein [Candidatus Dependentiae bacterium]|nr:acyltransferase domain-containing protein [Candidatus Dependentiae bacterium]